MIQSREPLASLVPSLTIQMSCSSPWFEDDDPALNPFDRQPSEWFAGEDKHCGVQEFDWGDPQEEEEEEEEEDTVMIEVSEDEDDSDMESVNSIPMSLGSFSTQSVYDDD